MAEYKVKRGDNLSKIAKQHGIDLNQLLSMNPLYKSEPDRLGVGDILRVPDAEGISQRPIVSSLSSEAQDWFKVPMGQLTFDVEGMEKPGSKYHSRVPHVPGRWSGVTIGRGYDMGQRSKEGIKAELLQAGVSNATANKFSNCSGFKGKQAKEYLDAKNLNDLSITPEQQYHLFLDTFEEYAGTVIRICSKADVVDKYGATNWEELEPVIRDIVVDLCYRGDYTSATRNKVQPIIVANSSNRLKRLMADEGYWRNRIGVPKDRFERRRAYSS